MLTDDLHQEKQISLKTKNDYAASETLNTWEY